MSMCAHMGTVGKATSFFDCRENLFVPRALISRKTSALIPCISSESPCTYMFSLTQFCCLLEAEVLIEETSLAISQPSAHVSRGHMSSQSLLPSHSPENLTLAHSTYNTSMCAQSRRLIDISHSAHSCFRSTDGKQRSAFTATVGRWQSCGLNPHLPACPLPSLLFFWDDGEPTKSGLECCSSLPLPASLHSLLSEPLKDLPPSLPWTPTNCFWTAATHGITAWVIPFLRIWKFRVEFSLFWSSLYLYHTSPSCSDILVVHPIGQASPVSFSGHHDSISLDAPPSPFTDLLTPLLPMLWSQWPQVWVSDVYPCPDPSYFRGGTCQLWRPRLEILSSLSNYL